MPELLQERRISARSFVGHYAAAIAGGGVLAVGLFLIPGAGVLAPLGFLPPAAMWVYAQLLRAGTSYRLFPDRLEVESGLLSRSIENLELFRVRDVGLKQGLFGRLADFGDIHIYSTDASTPSLMVRGVDAPREFYHQFRQLVSESRAQSRTVIVEEGEAVSG